MDPAERALALGALVRLAAMRVAVATVSFKRIRAYIDAIVPGVSPPSSDDERRAGALAVRRAMIRAQRTLPGSTCLARSLAAELMLRERGLPATLRIGVAGRAAIADVVAGFPAAPGSENTTPPSLDAHAWVESGTVLVAGDADVERYTALASFGANA
jgi:hypothetical protein